MSLPLDDAQVARHSMTQMAEHTKIMFDALDAMGFPDELRDKMVLAWWSSLLSSALTPDLTGLIEGFLGRSDDDA